MSRFSVVSEEWPINQRIRKRIRRLACEEFVGSEALNILKTLKNDTKNQKQNEPFALPIDVTKNSCDQKCLWWGLNPQPVAGKARIQSTPPLRPSKMSYETWNRKIIQKKTRLKNTQCTTKTHQKHTEIRWKCKSWAVWQLVDPFD